MKFLVVLLTLFLFTFNSFAQQVKGPRPNWVKPELVPFEAKLNEHEIGLGYGALLIDHQYNLMEEEEYYHSAIKVINETGVQEASSLSIAFDPAYQKLRIHRILIWRNGKSTDQLPNLKIELLHQEANLQDQIYNGKLTSFVNLKDIRKGDIIEYEYTLTGFNPVFKGVFSTIESVGFSEPVPLISFRLLAPTDRFFISRAFGKKSINFKTSPKGTYKEMYFKTSSLESVQGEENTPGWYFTWPVFAITEFRNWEQVRSWAKELFMFSGASAEIKKAIAKIKERSTSETDFIMNCIRFVQDEVRYTGIEAGIHSHKPHNPDVVLKQRFGDCKDKSLLLVSMLMEAGYNAYPVLVSTSYGKSLPGLLADGLWFNHAIVGFSYGGEHFYVDPTISNQGGDLRNFQIPDYGYGLRIGPEFVGENLNMLASNPSVAITKITENYFVKDSIGPVNLEVVTIYNGADADAMRGQLASNSKKSMEASYLDYYKKLYPGTSRTGEIQIEDDRMANELLVKEYYTIQSLWHYNEEVKVMNLELYSNSIMNSIVKPEKRERFTPFALAYPKQIQLDIRVRLPESWPINPKTIEVENPAFKFVYSTKNESDQDVLVTYQYRSLKPEVDPDQSATFYADLEKLNQFGSYQFSWSSDTISGAGSTVDPEKDGLNTTFLLYGNLLLTGLVILFYLLYKWNPSFSFEAIEDEPNSIGSWLILIALGLGVSVPVHVYHLFTSDFFNQGLWNNISNEGSAFYNPDIANLFFVEYLFRVYALTATIFLNILFYTRRNSFPIFYSVYLASVLVYAILEYLASTSLAMDEATKSDALKALSQSIVSCAVWIPYIWISHYSRNTFLVKFESKQEKLEKRLQELESLQNFSEPSVSKENENLGIKDEQSE